MLGGRLHWAPYFPTLVLFLTVKKKRTTGPSNSIDIVEVNKGHADDLDQNREYQTLDENQAQMGGTFGNPSYGESVDSAQSTAKPRPGGDYEEIKEGSAANEGHYQQLDSKRNPDYEGLKPSYGLDTSL